MTTYKTTGTCSEAINYEVDDRGTDPIGGVEMVE